MRQAEEIQQGIWALVKQEISCACPFLMLGCTVFETEEKEEIPGFGTDGKRLLYSEQWLFSLYEKTGRKELNRSYLHVLFHCLYLHMWDREQRDEKLWDLACDIVAEYTVDYLNVPWILGEAREEKKQIYRLFWEDAKSRSAREVYTMLENAGFEESRIRRWKQIFCRDTHMYWNEMSREQMEEIKKLWGSIIAKSSREGGGGGKKRGSQAGESLEWYEIQEKRRYDYRRFLRRFAVEREEVQLDLAGFDYIPYCYGIEMYGNMPLVEPLEYTEARKLQEMVIAIDTSSSCSRAVVQRFLEETYSMLSSRENFFRRMRVHIIQCDCYIQEDVVLTSEEEWKAYLKNIKIQGRGGTDFRPVFRYVNKQIEEKKILDLKGLLYFTDGDGIYPEVQPAYETAFLLPAEPKEEVRIPSWAIKLILDERERWERE